MAKSYGSNRVSVVTVGYVFRLTISEVTRNVRCPEGSHTRDTCNGITPQLVYTLYYNISSLLETRDPIDKSR